MGEAVSKKILVVEDDPVNLQILSDFLSAHGYQTRGAINGPDGVASFRRERPDLMLVDIQLPRKNGFEVCWEVKRTPEGADVPVLLMSAVYTPGGQDAQFSAPSLAAGFLAKPFDLADLLTQVHNLIGEAEEAGDDGDAGAGGDV